MVFEKIFPPAWNCYGAPRLYRGIRGSARGRMLRGGKRGGGHNVIMALFLLSHRRRNPTGEGLGRQVGIEVEGEKTVGCFGDRFRLGIIVYSMICETKVDDLLPSLKKCRPGCWGSS